MDASQYFIIRIIAILMVTLVLASCGSVHTTNGDISVMKKASSIARFLNVSVDSADSRTSISGTLENKGASRKKIPGHVDVAILSKDKEVVNEARAELERVSHQPRYAVFSIVMDHEVPSNGIVIVKHHKSKLHE